MIIQRIIYIAPAQIVMKIFVDYKGIADVYTVDRFYYRDGAFAAAWKNPWTLENKA